MHDLSGNEFIKNRFIKLSMLALIAILLLPNVGLCQVSQTAVPFLLMSPDAYGQGMGYGGSAFSSGAVSAFYNPANLVTVNSLSAEISYTDALPHLRDNLSYKSINLAGVIKEKWYFGAAVNYFDLGTRKIYNEIGERCGTERVYEMAANISGAMRINQIVSVGATIKYIRCKWDYSIEYSPDLPVASGLAFDVGICFQNLFPSLTYYSNKTYYHNFRENFRDRNSKGVNIGLSIVNLGPELKYQVDYSIGPLPRTFRMGLGYQAVDMEQLGLRFTIDATKLIVDTDDGLKNELQEIDLAGGVEATFYYLFSLRMGRYHDETDQEKFWTFGYSLGPEWLRFNYARVLDNDDYRTNRRANEQTFSVYCNLPARILNW